MSDEKIVGGSFEELAMPLFDSLYNFARWLTHDREEAEDLVQETYGKALKGFASFQPGTNFRAWMFRILRNTFLTSRTGLKSGATVSLDSEEGEFALPTTAETPESLLLERSNQHMVREAIVELPVILREVILLFQRRRGNVLPGNRGNHFDPDRDGDVPPGKSPKCAPSGTNEEVARGLKHGV